jgi:diacylglycerol kinase (ATP)
MKIEKIAILLNPSAGRGKALRKREKLEERLRKYDIPYDLFVTQSEEDLKRLTRKKSEEYEVLVGAGGDSTFNIMLEEILRCEANVALGMIGLGSSNDVAREFGIDSLDKACLALKNRHTKRIDLGCIAEDDNVLRHYIGQANVGLGAFVTKYADEMAKARCRWFKGQVIVGFSGIIRAYRSKEIPLPLAIMTSSGEVRGRFILASFNNIRYWATGRLLCPDALPDDGRLDACLIEGCLFFRFVQIALSAKKGGHTNAGEVETLQSPCFAVSSDIGFEIQTDGEFVQRADGSTRFKTIQFKILPQALSVICGT